MTGNRDRALGAAIDLLAEEGIRSLTHLRVDRRAGLPVGSTSNAFRTREALLLGVCEAMVAQESPALAGLARSRDAGELGELLHSAFAQLVGPGRRLTAARLALFVEASHDEAVRTALAGGRSVIEVPVREAFTHLGAADPDIAVQIVASCFEGLFLQVLGGYAAIDAAPVIDAAVRAGLTAPAR